MAEERGRAWRRAKRERAVKKAEKVLRNSWYHPTDDRDELIRRNAKRYADNLKVCSCWMCRNLRQDEGPTKQERNADDIEDYFRHT